MARTQRYVAARTFFSSGTGMEGMDMGIEMGNRTRTRMGRDRRCSRADMSGSGSESMVWVG